MKVRILKNQIHHFIEDGRDVLQLDIQYPDYPEISTYGIKVDMPVTERSIKSAIRAHSVKVKEQIARDELIRQKLANILEFDTEVENELIDEPQTL